MSHWSAAASSLIGIGVSGAIRASIAVEGIRSLVITGWDGRALALGFGCALALVVLSLGFASAAIKNRLVRT